MKSLRIVLVLGLLSSFLIAGCVNIKAPETVNVGGDDGPKTKSEWKEYGRSYYDNGDED